MAASLGLLFVGVEDASLRLLKPRLMAAHLRLSAAPSIGEAWQAAGRDEYHVIVLSAGLPHEDLLRFAQAVRGQERAGSALAGTGLILVADGEGVRAAAQALGAHAYLYPPLDPDDVIETVSSLGWAGRLRVQQAD